MRLNKSIIMAGVSAFAVFAASQAFAQSTATETVETVIIKGSRNVGVVKKESGTKTKTVVGQELISLGSSGQTVVETLNVVPGLNFTNTDAYGSSGGNLRIRGMDGSRISLTVDGVQLNDSGNYAIYTNQQLEPELICQASVSTGATDVDSMSASASGGTINYNTCRPEDNFGGVVKLTTGSFNFKNGFFRLDSGKFGPWGTKAFAAVTLQNYDTWTVDAGAPADLDKKQYNVRVFQELPNDSYVSASAHYNENRNRFYFSQTKAQIYPTALNGTNGYNYNPAGLLNINPSNTGNFKIQSKFNLTDTLAITFDPTYQYVLANGGGSASVSETDARLCGTTFGTAGCGVDLNKDGDKLDSVLLHRPSNTNTNRFSVTSSVIWKFMEGQTLRFGASADRARHRQTGEFGFLNSDGTAIDVFSGKVDDSVSALTADGDKLQNRNRYSEANVDVFSLEYRGRFLQDKLFVSLGLRNQKMVRNLNQYCYSQANGSGNVLCTKQPTATSVATADSDVNIVTFGTSTTKYFTPFSRTYEFKKTLPNVGVTYKLDDANQLFASYSESMSSPRTDSYYNVSLLANKLTAANPEIETSTNFEFGYRLNLSNLYVSASLFGAEDSNRIVSSFDPDDGSFKDRNVGDVKRQGFEAQASWEYSKALSFNASYTKTDAKLQNNLIVGGTAAAPITIATAGKTLAETPKKMATVGVNYDFNDKLHFNLSGKYVGDRYSTDMNDDIAPAYTVWNASMRWDLDYAKPGTYLQLNVINLLDEQYLGNITSRNNAYATLRSDGSTQNASLPSFNVGTPRTITLALRTKF